MVNKWSIMG